MGRVGPDWRSVKIAESDTAGLQTAFSVNFSKAKTAYLAKQLKYSMNISRAVETFSKCHKIISVIGII